MIGKVIRRLAAEAREFHRWQALRSADDIRVYYGMDRLPTRAEPVSGGIVKFLDLAERFPNSPDNPNLLYLVSSALPARRELLARSAQRAGGRFVLNQNGVAYPAWAGTDWREHNAPMSRVHAMADFVVYQSEFCKICAEKFLAPRKGPCAVFYNPVDTAVFSPRDGYDVSTSETVLLAAGSHHDAYRVKLAIDALAVVRRKGFSARLKIAGRLVWGDDAEAEARRWALVAGVDGSIEFIGEYVQRDAPALFRSADILVHLKVQDPCPRLVVEAMACGVPVLYSATGGTRELVGGKAGYGIMGENSFEKFNIPTVNEVADGVIELISGRQTYARSARDRAVGMFQSSVWVEAHSEIFESLAGH